MCQKKKSAEEEIDGQSEQERERERKWYNIDEKCIEKRDWNAGDVRWGRDDWSYEGEEKHQKEKERE